MTHGHLWEERGALEGHLSEEGRMIEGHLRKERDWWKVTWGKREGLMGGYLDRGGGAGWTHNWSKENSLCKDSESGACLAY